MMGFGPIGLEPDEPWFHAPWERRAFGLTLAMGATGSLEHRHDAGTRARACRPPNICRRAITRSGPKGLEKLSFRPASSARRSCAWAGAHGASAGQARPEGRRRSGHAGTGGPADRPRSTRRASPSATRSCTRNMHPSGHTRLPRYARGKPGGRAGARRPRVSRRERPRPGRKSAMALHDPLLRAANSGARRPTPPLGLDRCLGELP